MGPPHRQSVAETSQQLGIHVITLYKWRKAWRLQGEVVPATQKDPEGWGPADKFTVVLESAGLNATELNGSNSGPLPGWPGYPPRLRPLPLRHSGGFNPGPSLEGGLEELRELRPIRSCRLASSLARAESLLGNSSFSCCWARINCLASGGRDSQSASGIPARGVLITGGLCL